jgi:hypothetical protein
MALARGLCSAIRWYVRLWHGCGFGFGRRTRARSSTSAGATRTAGACRSTPPRRCTGEYSRACPSAPGVARLCTGNGLTPVAHIRRRRPPVLMQRSCNGRRCIAHATWHAARWLRHAGYPQCAAYAQVHAGCGAAGRRGDVPAWRVIHGTCHLAANRCNVQQCNRCNVAHATWSPTDATCSNATDATWHMPPGQQT